MSGHTEGPWLSTKPVQFQTEGMTFIVKNAEGYPSAFVPAWTEDASTAEEAAANARLIAAAPDMFEALKHCEEIFQSHEINRVDGEEITDSALNLIRAALHKASPSQSSSEER